MIEQFFDTAVFGFGIVMVGLLVLVILVTALIYLAALPVCIIFGNGADIDQDVVDMSVFLWCLILLVMISYLVGAIAKTLL